MYYYTKLLILSPCASRLTQLADHFSVCDASVVISQSAAGALFFWSYELLVFMVLLNFLLAIIVDAFSEVGV